MVEIEYKKPKEEKAWDIVVAPLGFLYGVQNNYLIAGHKGDADETRHYILDRVLDVKITDKPFDAKGFDIHKYSAKSFGVWVSGDGHKVKWRVLPEVAEKAKRFVFHPTQEITEQKDGSLIVEFVVEGLKEMVWHLIT